MSAGLWCDLCGEKTPRADTAVGWKQISDYLIPQTLSEMPIEHVCYGCWRSMVNYQLKEIRIAKRDNNTALS